MGRRSKALLTEMRTQRILRTRARQRLKPPWECPICGQMTVDYIKRQGVIFVFCQRCREGEVMPLLKGYQPIDYYNYYVDACRTQMGKADVEPPVWKLPKMSERQFQILKKRITYGKLVRGEES